MNIESTKAPKPVGSYPHSKKVENLEVFPKFSNTRKLVLRTLYFILGDFENPKIQNIIILIYLGTRPLTNTNMRYQLCVRSF